MRATKLLFCSITVLAALAMAACGSSGSTRTTPSNPPASVAPAANQPSTTPCVIPQNNGGDHDADNNGGPSDGDGCDR